MRIRRWCHATPVQVRPLLPAAHGPAHWIAPWRAALAMGLAALNGNRLRSALSMLGISIGIAAVIGITALGDAASGAVQRSAREASSSQLNIDQGNRNLPAGAVAQPLTVRDVAALRTLPGATAVVPNYSSHAIARHGRRDDEVTISGIDVGDNVLGRRIVMEGRDIGAQDLEARAQVVLLDRAAREALFATGEPVLGQQIIIGGALPFTVIGIIAPLFEANPSFTAFMPMARVQGKVYVPQTTYTTKLDTRGEINRFSVHFATPVPTASFVAHTRQRLLALHGGIEDFAISSNDQLMATIFQPLISRLTPLFAGIAAISLLVGGIGVMNIMLVSVSERTREIGIRMAVGARQRDVRRQFLIESVLLCCVGGLAGLALPWLGTLAMPLSLSRHALAVALGTCAAIGLLFGYLPARKAAAQSPVDALARD